jgi:hypothetical protein
MSEYQILTVFAAFAFVYSLMASRLEKTPINGALIYIFVGMIGCAGEVETFGERRMPSPHALRRESVIE